MTRLFSAVKSSRREERQLEQGEKHVHELESGVGQLERLVGRFDSHTNHR